MSKLLRYSIETDQTVLLKYDNSSEQRVSIACLRDVLKGDDLKRVQNALRVRKSFFKRHLPKLAITIAAGGLISVIGLTQQKEINILMHHTEPQPSAEHHPKLTSYAQTLATLSPTPSPGQPLNVLSAAASPSLSPTISQSRSLVPSSAPAHKFNSEHHWRLKILSLDLPVF